MNIIEIANSWWMYLLGAIVVLFVLAGCIFFIIKAFKDAKKLNMETKVLKKVIFDSFLFTLLPSISILIGVVALSGTLGVPLPWIRLTVIGALHYEGAAVKAVIGDATSIATPEMFVTIAFVMTLGILTGPIYCLLGFKAYDKKVLAKARVEQEQKEKAVEEFKGESTEVIETEKEEKPKGFGSILFNAVFIAMVSSFLAIDIVKIFKTGTIDKEGVPVTPVNSYIPLIVIGVTFLAMFVCDYIEKKFNQKWLSSFGLGLSMIIGMASAVIINLIAM